jgi:hypothetical protein
MADHAARGATDDRGREEDRGGVEGADQALGLKVEDRL